MHPNLKQYIWHSHYIPPIFCRLDDFLISENLRNFIVSSRHSIGFKSNHSIVSLNIDLINLTWGPGYFKLNSSLLLNEDYQEPITKNIAEIAEINKDANPNTKMGTNKRYSQKRNNKICNIQAERDK